MPAGFVAATSTSSGATSIDITGLGHQSGDLLLCLHVRTGSTTVPGTPTGFTSITSASNNSFSDTASRLSYKVSDGTETSVVSATSGVFLVGVYRVADATPVNASAVANDVDTGPLAFPGLTLTASPSWVVCLGYSNNGSSTPTDFTPRHSTEPFCLYDSGAEVSSFSSSGSVSGDTTSSHLYAYAVELSLVEPSSGSAILFRDF